MTHKGVERDARSLKQRPFANLLVTYMPTRLHTSNILLCFRRIDVSVGSVGKKIFLYIKGANTNLTNYTIISCQEFENSRIFIVEHE